MKRKTVLILFFLCTLDVLFAAKTAIHPFFQRILLKHPSLPQLEFQVSAGNNATAFLTLTHWLSRSMPLEEYISLLPEELASISESLIEREDEGFSYASLLAKKPGELELFIALGHILSARYQRSRLSGVWAEKGWTLLYAQIESALAQRKPAPDPAALLHLAQQMHFFRDSRKWNKKCGKILKKLAKTPSIAVSPLASAILSTR